MNRARHKIIGIYSSACSKKPDGALALQRGLSFSNILIQPLFCITLLADVIAAVQNRELNIIVFVCIVLGRALASATLKSPGL
jgi:hypothetical protein